MNLDAIFWRRGKGASIRTAVCLALALTFGVGLSSAAQVATPETQGLLPLENGYFLEVIPEKYVTVTESREYIIEQAEEWVTVPAVFETVTETQIIQEAYRDLDITSAVLAEDGSIIDAAKLEIKEFPAVTKQVSRRVVKTPATLVKRHFEPVVRTKTETRRERVQPKAFVLYDEGRIEIARYDNPADFMAAIESN